MKDVYGNIIYIGKSKSLKSRVRSYFNTQHKWKKIERMVFHIDDIDFIVTDTHLEAQILECALIKKLKPIYNAQFKNHEKYIYLKIEESSRFKPIKVVRDRDGENCFGPYRSKNMLPEAIKVFENIYPIIKSGDTYEFDYKVLPQAMKEDVFKRNRESLVEIFTRKEYMLEFLTQIENKMTEAAMELQFERASTYRDIHYYIKYLYDYDTKKINHLNERNLLMGEKIEDGYKIFYISDGSIMLKRKYKEVTRKAIEEFVVQAKELENRIVDIKNEKRDLDFKYIINTEIQDRTSKAILFLNGDYEVDNFINDIMEIN